MKQIPTEDHENPPSIMVASGEAESKKRQCT